MIPEGATVKDQDFDYVKWDVWNARNSPKFPHSKVIQFVFRNFSTPVRPGTTAFDLGCGSGSNTAFLCENGFATTATDVSGVAVKRTREAIQARGLRAEVLKVPIDQVALGKQSLDLVLCVGVLEFVPDPSAAEVIDRIVEGLKPEGKALLIFAAEGDFRKSDPVAIDLAMQFRSREQVDAICEKHLGAFLWIDQYITTYEGDACRQIDWLITMHKE